MKDRTFLLSMILAVLFHAAALAVNFPEARSSPVMIPPSVEVTLEPAVASAFGSLPGPPAEIKKAPAPVRVRAPKHRLPNKIETPPQKPAPVIQPDPLKESIDVKPEPQQPELAQLEETQSPPSTVVAVGPASDSIEQAGFSAGASPYSIGGVPGGFPGASEGSAAGAAGAAGFDRIPAYLHNPKPKYPRAARQAGQQGSALLRVEVLFNGRAGKIVLEKSTGFDALDREALEAVKKWRFTPAQKGKLPVTAWVRIPIEFNLKD